MKQILSDFLKLTATLLLSAVAIFIFFMIFRFFFGFTVNSEVSVVDTSKLITKPVFLFSITMIIGLPISMLWIFKKELVGLSTQRKLKFVSIASGFLFSYLFLTTAIVPSFFAFVPALLNF